MPGKAVLRMDQFDGSGPRLLDDARQKVEDWRVEYDEVRLHSAIGGRPPMALLRQALGALERVPGPEILT